MPQDTNLCVIVHGFKALEIMSYYMILRHWKRCLMWHGCNVNMGYVAEASTTIKKMAFILNKTLLLITIC